MSPVTSQPKPFELGLYTFVDYTPDPITGQQISGTQRVQNLIAEAELAEQVGLDVFAVGEHHREDYISSAPSVLLAAIAARTEKIRLSSSVTVLSSDDPVRVHQRFSTLDLISQGRAEIIAGRGSFTESFPLFGYELSDYNELFEEKLHMLVQLREEEKVTWEGNFRPSFQDRGVYPRPHQDKLPLWVAVGGTPQSVVRAGTYGLPLALAIIGGMPEQFGPMADLYRRVMTHYGRDESETLISVNSHGHIAETRQQAIDQAFPYFKYMMDKIGRERGWTGMTRQQFDASTDLRGANFIGSPDEIIEKILYQHEIFNHDRLLIQLGLSTMPHDQIMRAIELLGTKVAPVVRAEIAKKTAVPA